MPTSPYRFILSYLPELRRLTDEVHSAIAACERAVEQYEEAEEHQGDLVEAVSSIDGLLGSATRLLLTTRAGCLSAGIGQRNWVS